MTQDEIEALLGRSLTAREADNIALYLEIATEEVEGLLCISLDYSGDESGEQVAEERTYKARKGYSTVFTDIFSEVTSVTVNGEAGSDYDPQFWDNPNSGYYNSIVLDEPLESDSVVVTAVWGFVELPSDLKRLIAQAFDMVAKKHNVSDVSSKKVEDFSISYGSLSDNEKFIRDNALVIRKYSMCTIGNIQHGAICE